MGLSAGVRETYSKASFTLRGMVIDVINPRGRRGRKSPVFNTRESVFELSNTACSIFASNANKATENVERPSHETSVPATVAELRMFSGASSFSAGFRASGQYSDSSSD